MRLLVRWARQGQVKWGEAWVDEHGPTRERVPDEKDHLSFVNYDLTRNGLSKVLRSPTNGKLWIAIPGLEDTILRILAGQQPSGAPDPAIIRLLNISAILKYHGFVLVPEDSTATITWESSQGNRDLSRVLDLNIIPCVIDLVRMARDAAHDSP